ncbi:C4-dicarboxylate transport sensor protein DctB [Grimontia celer]|uniref:C4-dicarboxylate transport sensor protein DctB n=1 Tax=Grimontia celer TaxID=1796497 RepID=A0A128F3J0_9GAMM|nr:ATP-binding protein [Grimontia celer]CZF80816.1 C4-dicarboxylate transport sensor protein DctB [Grimontia celer]
MRRRLFISLVIAIGVLLTVMVGSFTYSSVEKRFTTEIEYDVYQLQEKLSAELARYSEIPVVLSADPRLKRLLRVPNSERLLKDTNLLLSNWNARLNSDVLYLMDRNGLTLAASNADAPQSFVGHNYNYRPYFQQALKGQKGRYYALGVVSDKRGYYFSYPIWDGKEITGVLTLKVDLSIIDSIWDQQKFDYLIADPLGVVFYSSRDEWLYQSLSILSDPQKENIRDSRRYGDSALSHLTKFTALEDIEAQEALHLGLPNKDRERVLVSNTDLGSAGWRIYGFIPTSNAWPVVTQSVLIFATFYGLLVLVLTAWLQTVKAQRKLARLNDELEQKVASRTASLEETNTKLRQSIQQYEDTQKALRQTENELIQAAKLAMLGELSASINHEINQPLAAMRTYTENSIKLMDKERYDSVKGNLNQLNELIGMVADIVARFKIFARKQNLEGKARASLDDAITASLKLSAASFIKKGIQIACYMPEKGLMVNADTVQLEQVILNLLNNASQAVMNTPSPEIGIKVETFLERVSIHVWDNGPGVDNDTKKHIFSPFYTTKKEGLGLGLTICRRIVEEFGGSLQISDHPTGGAEFTITLQRLYDGDTPQ